MTDTINVKLPRSQVELIAENFARQQQADWPEHVRIDDQLGVACREALSQSPDNPKCTCEGFNTQDLHEAECELVSDPPPAATGEGSQSVSEGAESSRGGYDPTQARGGSLMPDPKALTAEQPDWIPGSADDLNLSSYYYDFDPTGNLDVDRILHMVARAGKAFHILWLGLPDEVRRCEAVAGDRFTQQRGHRPMSQDPNLPPGCTMAMIDAQVADECPECAQIFDGQECENCNFSVSDFDEVAEDDRRVVAGVQRAVLVSGGGGVIRRLRNTVLRIWRRLMKRTGGPLVVDLFAGPGGWDVGAWSLGIEPLGIEFDDAACDTRDAAGLHTLQADIGELDPSDFGPIDGLIASPPCQAFSMAGKGEGRKAIDLYCELIERYDGSVTDEDLAPIKDACADERAHLVLEPLRWAFALDPDWIACEQVEPVLPIWEAMGGALRKRGYSTWAGVLSSEQYGVPQTRRRAFLIASKLGPVAMPKPTHRRFIAPRAKLHDKQEDSLFDAGERTRIVHPDDRGLLPWVSMAEALGWADGPSPSPSVTGGGGESGGVEVFASKGARHRVASAVEFKRSRGAGFVERHGERVDRAGDEPAPTVTEKARSAEWNLRAGTNANDAERAADEPAPTMRFGERLNNVSWRIRANAQANAAVRSVDEPAPTIKGGHDTGERVWEPTHYDQQQTGASPRPITEPAPTQLAEGLAKGVPAARSDRNPDYQSGDGPVSQANGGNAVRVTQQEAAILQSFPADYPWQGSRTKQFQQIGNAVPPLLALAVLRAVVPMQARAAYANGSQALGHEVRA